MLSLHIVLHMGNLRLRDAKGLAQANRFSVRLKSPGL